MANLISHTFPKDVGILAIELYFPKRYVEQTELEKHYGVSAGRYTIGLGQKKMGICDDREDINSIALTTVQNLVEKFNISYKDIGRIEVGTESIIDKSKSVKTVLMQLFAESGNTDVEGIDTVNACYGGTSALFNAINWIESSWWDGRYALVVAGDIAVYASGPARPTGGAGCVALLVGANAPIVFDRGLRATHMEHAWDFYKPNFNSEFPEVDGQLSNVCYLKSLDVCYNRYIEKLAAKEHVENPGVKFFDYTLFHAPYCKLVQKSFARLYYNDFVRNPDEKTFESVRQFKDISVENSFNSKELEKAFMNLSKDEYTQRVLPTLLVATEVGNMYTASLYGALVSLLASIPAEELIGKRLGLFSYGSGLTATFFSLQITGTVSHIVQKLNIQERLKSRAVSSPQQFEEIMRVREVTHGRKDYTPLGDGTTAEEVFFEGSYYLDHIDSKWRRSYKRTARHYATPRN